MTNNQNNNNDFNNINNNQFNNNINQDPNINSSFNMNSGYNMGDNNMNNGYNSGYYNNPNNGYDAMNSVGYNDYNNMTYYKKPLSHYIKRFLIGFLCAALFIFLLLWLFPTKSNLNDSLNSALNPFYDRIFQENLDTMKEDAIAYYTTDRLPKKEGDTKKLTLGEMLEMKLLLAIKDKNGNMCDTEDSYVELTKLEDEYKMKVNLKCGDEEDYIIVYLGCYDYCLNDICEKKEDTKEVVATGSSGGSSKVSSFFKSVKKTVNKTVHKVTEIIVPDRPDKPDEPDNPDNPEDPVYKYLYRKTVTIHHDAEYSEWSDWSSNIEYDPDNTNIDWGKHDLVWYEKVGYKLTTTYQVNRSKPIWQKVEKQVGSYTKYGCAEYNYFMDSTTNTTYITSSGGWVYSGTVVSSVIPDSTSTVKYVFGGLSYQDCGNVCDITPKYKLHKYTRTASSTTTTSDTASDLRAVCKTVTKKQIPIYSTVHEIVGYEVDKVQTKTYYYHKKTRTLIQKAYDETKTYEAWSYSKNDQTLINQGYKYTGIYKKVD